MSEIILTGRKTQPHPPPKKNKFHLEFLYYIKFKISTKLNAQQKQVRAGHGSLVKVRPLDMETVAGSIFTSHNILSWRLVVKSFQWPFSPYRWFK